jgi:hypothetical protein
MKHSFLIGELVLSGLMLTTSALAAQNAGRPSAEQCQAAATALAQGARHGTGWERLVDCGDIAGNALAEALRAASSETDVDYLARLYSAIARVRHPAIFRGTLEVMRDPAASVPARATAILMALSQHEPGWGVPPSLPFREVVTSPASTAEICQLVRFRRTLYRSSTPLPADYREQLVNATEQLGSAPPVVRGLARCAARIPRRELGIDVSKLGLEYLCGNRFRATNRSGEWVSVSWDVPGTKDKGGLMIPPAGETIFVTERRGDTRLSYRGKLVKTEPNAGKPCTS